MAFGHLSPRRPISDFFLPGLTKRLVLQTFECRVNPELCRRTKFQPSRGRHDPEAVVATWRQHIFRRSGVVQKHGGHPGFVLEYAIRRGLARPFPSGVWTRPHHEPPRADHFFTAAALITAAIGKTRQRDQHQAEAASHQPLVHVALKITGPRALPAIHVEWSRKASMHSPSL